MSPLPILLSLALAADPALPTVRPSFLYSLSDFTGPVRSLWAQLSYDRKRDEVLATAGGVVGIFNRVGMQVYEYGTDGSLGVVLAAVALDDGDQLVLTVVEGKWKLTLCDYRGEAVGPFELKGLRTGWEDFRPDLLAYRDGKIYLASSGSLRVVVADGAGQVIAHHDLVKILQLDEKGADAASFRGMGVDPAGRILLTMPLAFKVAVLSPDGTARTFGQRGSTPGKFNIIGKMDADEKGYYYLTDILRSVVMVFDPDLNFLGEFGYRGDGPDNFISPADVAAGNGKIYVAQAANRGVAVVRVEIVPPPPPEPQPGEAPASAPAGARPAGPTSPPASPPSRAAPR